MYGVGTTSTMYRILLLIAIKFAKGMGKTFLQLKYVLVSPLVILPNSVAFRVKLLKFSAVAFSILIKTSSVFDELFVQAINDSTKTIKVIGRLLFIFFFLHDSRLY